MMANSEHAVIGDQLHVYCLAGIVGLFFFVLTWTLLNKPNLNAIPTIGPTGMFSSYRGAFRSIKDTNGMVQEGYDQYKESPFKIATLGKWMVVVSGPKLVEELRHAADDELSFSEAAAESLAINYTLGSEIHDDPYHIPILRTRATKNLAVVFPDIRDEVLHAFEDAIPPTTDWTKVPATETIMQVICRTTNRFFVGLPLCRNQDWLALNINFTIDVVKTATMINLFPDFMKPIAGRLVTKVHANLNRGMQHLGPIIIERQRYIDEYGKDWDEKPNDMLSWLMDEAQGDERSTRSLTRRVLALNFAAIHTSSMTLVHALYHLAAMPQYIQPMREEVQAAVRKDGWTKAAISEMHKVDSFLKESQRCNGLGAITMLRKALKNFTFSDGTTIPKGTFISAASYAIHHDEENYPDPDTFHGFRFADIKMSDGESLKNQFVATNMTYIPFGHGRHACPGRFFAANELKMMMAHLVITYDIKLENEGVRPPNQWFVGACVPNRQAEILFRKHQH